MLNAAPNRGADGFRVALRLEIEAHDPEEGLRVEG
jgi:hypothetical protein